MKLPTIDDGLSPQRGATAPRPVPRLKRAAATSLCAGGSTSWAFAARVSAPYRYGEGCLCLSPEQHGAQFRADGWELAALKGSC